MKAEAVGLQRTPEMNDDGVTEEEIKTPII
jgi:hypothetical protein